MRTHTSIRSLVSKKTMHYSRLPTTNNQGNDNDDVVVPVAAAPGVNDPGFAGTEMHVGGEKTTHSEIFGRGNNGPLVHLIKIRRYALACQC